jgi:hypothetical protein
MKTSAKMAAAILMGFSSLWLSGCSSSSRVKESADHSDEAAGSILLQPMLYLIHRHREHSTHIDGATCPMYPSCAAYGEKAMKQKGILGLLLLTDRMFYRETGNLIEKYMVAPEHLSNEKRFYDPLSDSTFGGPGASLLKEDFR